MDVWQSFNLDAQSDPLQVYSLAVLTAGLLLFMIWAGSSRKLAHIPTIGPSGKLTSYLGAFRYLKNANEMLQEGYYKYKGSAFKIPTFSRWMVIICGPKAIDELRQAAEADLSMIEATKESIAIDYTLGSNQHTDIYHVSIIRNRLTKNLGVIFPDMRDEIIHSFDDVITPTADWTQIAAHEAIMRIVSRTSNRVFVGLPLCRVPDWLDLNVEFAIDVVKAAAIIRLFPEFLKPIVGRLLTSVPSKIRRGMKHMVPIIEDRRQYIEEYGDQWDGKPNDMLAWLMDEASEAESTARNLTLRMMSINLAATHTTTIVSYFLPVLESRVNMPVLCLQTFTHTLYCLAAMPHYLPPLREEIEAIIDKDGWNRAAMSKMHKLDSFFKESLRMRPVAAAMLDRIAVKDFQFSDGTFVPKGSYICVATELQRDEANFANPEVFDGFRFIDKGLSADDNGKNQMVSVGPNYIPFGYGRHACPGRFFVSNELKAMMAHLVVTYDVKLENEGVRPPDFWFATSCTPNPTAKVLFRKRQP